jgi:hypothetical protein
MGFVHKLGESVTKCDKLLGRLKNEGGGCVGFKKFRDSGLTPGGGGGPERNPLFRPWLSLNNHYHLVMVITWVGLSGGGGYWAGIILFNLWVAGGMVIAI